MENERTERRETVVLVPCPFQGHISPMLELGTALQSKGFSVIVAHTHFNSPKHSGHPDLAFLPIPDGLTEGEISSGDLLAIISALNTNCEGPLEQSLAQLIDGGDQVACIVYDTLMHVAETMANRLKLPSIVLRTSGASALQVYGAMPKLHEAGHLPFQDSKEHEAVPGLPELRFKDLPLVGDLEALLQLTSTVCNIRTSVAVIWNTIDCLEQFELEQLQQEYNVPFFSVGPLFKMASNASNSLLEEDTNCLTWLDKQAPHSVLYVSLGSLAFVEKKELEEMAWGLSNSGQPFLWVVRPGSVCGSEWIELLPEGVEDVIRERGCIVKWAPQKEVLAHRAVGGFWSHCGWNSTLESISEGVLMICSPCFGDQKVDARYVSHVWKVGLEMEGVLERGTIERAVRRLMVEKETEDTRRRASDFKEKVKLCVRKGGSSYNSLNDLAKFIWNL